MRRFLVKMIVETNDNPDKEIYYDDQEMHVMIATWIDAALEDRDDGPRRTFAEITTLDVRPSVEQIRDGGPDYMAWRDNIRKAMGGS